LQNGVRGFVVRAFVLRAISAVVLALPLSGCLRDPYVSTSSVVTSGQWKIDRMTDRVAGAPISSASVTAMASNAAEPFPQLSFMQLSCFINSPVISFKFPFKVGSERNSFLGYRFDENPGHETNARFVASASTVIIEDDKEVAEFARELATAKVLYIRIRSFNAGRTAAEFKVDGASAAIAAAYATCPVKPPAPAQRVATSGLKRRQ
jgi:hypothetical protein